MGYQFLAEKEDIDFVQLHSELTPLGSGLIEFFPIPGSPPSLGVSIPFKAMDQPEFSDAVVNVMRRLVSDRKFVVTDLYSGKRIDVASIETLPQRISA